jgi:hypothetical protein
LKGTGYLAAAIISPEGYGLQPVRKPLKAGTALAAEGTIFPFSDFFRSPFSDETALSLLIHEPLMIE